MSQDIVTDQPTPPSSIDAMVQQALADNQADVNAARAELNARFDAIERPATEAHAATQGQWQAWREWKASLPDTPSKFRHIFDPRA